MPISDVTGVIIASGVVSTAVQAILLLLIRYEIAKAIDAMKEWVEQFFARAETVQVKIQSIEGRIDRLPCDHCAAEESARTRWPPGDSSIRTMTLGHRPQREQQPTPPGLRAWAALLYSEDFDGQPNSELRRREPCPLCGAC
jgi:hypothetical protein